MAFQLIGLYGKYGIIIDLRILAGWGLSPTIVNGSAYDAATDKAGVPAP